MKLITISTDRKIFEKNSGVFERMKDYTTLFDEMCIIVFSLKKEKNEPFQISSNAWVYPTNSSLKIFYVWDAYKLAKELVRGGNLVSTQDPFETGIVGYFLKRFKRDIHLNVQVHTNFLSPRFRKHSILNRVRYYLAKFILPKANTIRVVSYQIKKGLLESKIKLESDPVVLPVFVPAGAVANSGDKRFFDIQVVVVSRLEPEKNLPLVINSFIKVAKKYPDLGIVFVGDGSERHKLEEIVENSGIKEQVIFAGWQENVSEYYSSSDIFMLISSYEGYNRTLVEAARFGLAIVSTEVAPVGEDLTSEEVVVVSLDADDISSCLEKVVINPEYRKSLGQKAVEKITKVQISKGEYLQRYKDQFYVKN